MAVVLPFTGSGGGAFQSMKQKHTHMHKSFKCHKTDISQLITKILHKFVLHFYCRLQLRLKPNICRLHKRCSSQKKWQFSLLLKKVEYVFKITGENQNNCSILKNTTLRGGV